MSTTVVSNVVVITQRVESGPVCRVPGSRAGCGPAVVGTTAGRPAKASAATTVRA
ncbi:hypothetical protein ACIHAX_30915 [Nocardia sp. NPDC051929]|uniref:hypothetical protein n=1 Tax=Nocardia sp. NPDC051929 TaxID=3364327 RepID=UPI0037C96377